MNDAAMTSDQHGGTSPSALPVGASLLFLLAAALYTLLDATGTEALWMAALKIVPIGVLFWLAAQRLVGTTRTLALLALGFSAIGDVLLAIPFANHFIFGLGAFLLAQLTYTVTFARNGTLSLCLAGRAFAVLVAVVLLGRQVLPAAGALALPVGLYILAISAMTLSAAAHRSGSSLLFAGALTFMASDALIAINRFVNPVPLAGTWIMLTYYVAQALLVVGLIRADLTARRA
ncbi:lysoplasmalogenase [Microbulbifer harenosus]|nr:MULTISPECIES: lysoplasmalogenase [Microbulbifer]